MFRYKITKIGDNDYYKEYEEIYLGAIVESIEEESCGCSLEGVFFVISIDTNTPFVRLTMTDVTLEELR